MQFTYKKSNENDLKQVEKLIQCKAFNNGFFNCKKTGLRWKIINIENIIGNNEYLVTMHKQ